MKVALCFSLTALLALTGGPALAQSSKEKPLTVRLGPQNKSGESGTARLTPQGSETRVEIALKGAPKGATQPAHIHEGTCAKLDPKPKQGLENVVDGKSSTVVPMRLDDLLKGTYAINVHKSTSDIKTYVACGDIKAQSAKKE